jgi:hypothetical protein
MPTELFLIHIYYPKFISLVRGTAFIFSSKFKDTDLKNILHLQYIPSSAFKVLSLILSVYSV